MNLNQIPDWPYFAFWFFVLVALGLLFYLGVSVIVSKLDLIIELMEDPR